MLRQEDVITERQKKKKKKKGGANLAKCYNNKIIENFYFGIAQKKCCCCDYADLTRPRYDLEYGQQESPRVLLAIKIFHLPLTTYYTAGGILMLVVYQV